MSALDVRSWLRCYRPSPRPALRLVCFPHAGGNAAFFRTWPSHLPEDVELHAVQYPGRMDRISEPPARRMRDLAAPAAAATAWLAARGPVILFGHSLGASVAHEVALRLVAQCGQPPAALAVSGRPPPQSQRDTAVHRADDETLWGELDRLGGTSAELLAHPSLRALMLPALRADYEVAETHRPATSPLPAPILACVGDADPEVTQAEALGWAEHSSAGFRLAIFPGDHFYLVPGEAGVVPAIVAGVRGLACVPSRLGGGP